jgi:hypothetical protein
MDFRLKNTRIRVALFIFLGRNPRGALGARALALEPSWASGVGSSRGSVLEDACGVPRDSRRLSAWLPSHPLRGLRARLTVLSD